MFDTEIDKFWRVIDLRLARAAYQLREAVGENLVVRRIADSSSQFSDYKIPLNISLHTKSYCSDFSMILKNDKFRELSNYPYYINGKSSEGIASEFVWKLYENLYDTWDNIHDIDTAFTASIEKLYELTDGDYPELLCNFELKPPIFSFNGIKISDTDFSISCKNANVEIFGTTTREKIVSYPEDIRNVWENLKNLR